MPKPALIYAWTVVAVGIAVATTAALMWESAGAAALLMCLALAALASTFKVALPGLTGTISPGFVFVLVAVATLSSSETVAIAIASALVQSLWRPKVWPSTLQVAFNAATMAVSSGLAYTLAHALSQGGSDAVLLSLGVAGVVLLVTNTLMVSAILCLLKGAPLYTVWRSLQPHVVPYYLAGGLLAGVWSRSELAASTGVAVHGGSERLFAGSLLPRPDRAQGSGPSH